MINIIDMEIICDHPDCKNSDFGSSNFLKEKYHNVHFQKIGEQIQDTLNGMGWLLLNDGRTYCPICKTKMNPIEREKNKVQ